MSINGFKRVRAGMDGRSGATRRWASSTAVLLVVPLMAVVGLSAPASAVNNVGVPAGDPAAGMAKLVVDKGSLRTASTVVGPLAGARFAFYRVSGSSNLSGGTLLPDTCTTDATGLCGVFVQLVGDSNADNYFYAVETSAPAGWTIADTWGGASDWIRYNSGNIEAGYSVANRTKRLPAADTTTDRVWPDVRDNPAAPQKCGLDIRMVFDVSGSISDGELTTFKNAGKGVIDALVSTPSRVSLSRFASQAANVSPLTSVTTAAGATAVKTAIDGIGRSGLGGEYTNWDRALWGSATTGEAYDVAVVITDGDPTVWGALTSGSTALRQVEEAIHSANALKATGAQVIAVGIDLTGAASIKRLNLISSQDSTYTTSWQNLGPNLRTIATGVCTNAVSVQKVVKDSQGNLLPNSTLSNGWQFSGSIGSPATIGAFAPTAAVNNQNGFTSAPVAIGVGQTPTVTLTETVQSGWTYKTATCTVDGQNVTVTQTTTPGRFTFPGKANSAMACVVTNQQDAPRLTLKKKLLNADGSGAADSAGQAWTLTATGAGGFSGAGNTAAVTAREVQAGVQYALSESTPAGYTNGTAWSCVKDSGTGTLTSTATTVTPAAGQVITCTITNQVRLQDLTVTKTAVPKFDRDYDWTITKSSTPGSRFEVPEGTSASVGYQVVVTPSEAKDTNFTVTGDITITNPNSAAIEGVTITDSLPDATCTLEGLATRTIQPGSTKIPYTCTLPDGTPTTTGTNTASLSWNPQGYHGTTGSATDTEEVDFADATVSTTDATARVTDSMVDIDGAEDGVVVNATEGQRTFTYTRTIAGEAGSCTDHDNTATVKPSDSAEATDSETVTVCVGRTLGVAVTAGADLERAYAWSIAKAADATTRTVEPNGAATFRYTVTVRAGQETPSGWRMSGTATVTNPNTYEGGDITADVTASTDLGGGSSCVVPGGTDVVVGTDDSVTLPVICTFTSAPASTGNLSVVATWDPPGEASSDTSSGVAAVAFTSRKDSDRTVAVVDDKTVPGQRVVLDPALTWSAGLVNTYTYDLVVAGGAAGACATYANTATVDLAGGADPSASATVTACTPAPEVLPAQAFGKAGGSVRASCQGTVRSKLDNRSGVEVTYKLRVGTKVHKIVVKSLSARKFTTKGKALAKVVLKAEGRTLDRVRIPARCALPEALPDTGLRGDDARLAAISRRWRP